MWKALSEIRDGEVYILFGSPQGMDKPLNLTARSSTMSICNSMYSLAFILSKNRTAPGF
jgi:hypothetical protein